MKNDLGLKLILVADMKKLIFYSAQGIKVLEKITEIDVPFDKHHRGEKSQSSYHKGSNPTSAFEPHTQIKDVEHKEASDFILAELNQVYSGNNNYNDLIIVAEPKLLGYLRYDMPNNLKKIISKEISKDLVHYNKNDIEEAVFS